MIKLGTQQLGSKLVRTLGEGESLKRVITEVVDGKTLTHVFDHEGKPILSRMKSNAVQQVGDKTVRTTTKVVDKRDYFMRTTTDRVYNDNSLIGSRAVFESGIAPDSMSKLSVSKQGGDDIRLQKYFSNGIVLRKGYTENVKAGMRHIYGDDASSMYYTNKGLPIPYAMNCDNAEGKTLREMKNWLAVNYPNSHYVRPEFKLSKLDVLDAKDVITPLDKAVIEEKSNSLGAFFNKTV